MEKVHYKVNLNELPGAQVRKLTGEQTAEGGWQFYESGNGEPDGKGRVRSMTMLSFDPKSGVIEVASAEYALDALPPSVAAKLEQPPASDMQQNDVEDVIDPEGTETSESQAASVRAYDGSTTLRALDAVTNNVLDTTRAYLKWTRNASHTRLGRSFHRADWWWAPRWYRVGKSFKHGNTGKRATTISYGQYYGKFFCGPTGHESSDAESIFEATPKRYYWHVRWHLWGDCPHLLYFDHIVVRP
jgi:hypothetical protein